MKVATRGKGIDPMQDSDFVHPENIPDQDTRNHVVFYDKFTGVLKGSVIAIALLLIAMAVFLA